MNIPAVLSALDLPQDCRVDQRVPKKLLLEHGAPAASDKRRINDGVEEILWLAALKPTTIGVPEYRDTAREYLEIAVLHIRFRAKANLTRLVELVHRAVPYPVLLLAEQDKLIELSVAHKRWAQNEAGKIVLDGEVVTSGWLHGQHSNSAISSQGVLALGRQPRASLYALYQGWSDVLLALRAVSVTGEFTVVSEPGQSFVRQDALRDCARIDADISRLRAVARKERQVARLVEINLEIQGLQHERASVARKIADPDMETKKNS